MKLILLIMIMILILSFPVIADNDDNIRTIIGVVENILKKEKKTTKQKPIDPKMIYINREQLDLLLEKSKEKGRREGYKEGYRDGYTDGLLKKEGKIET